MPRPLHTLLLAAALLGSLFLPALAQPRAEVVARGLAHPWALAFLPDGRLLVTERAGRLRIVGPDGFLDLGSITVATKPETTAQQVGGILTYLRRQSIQASLGIATDLDDDGNESASVAPAGRSWTPRA